MHHFGITADQIEYPGPQHECCDNCVNSCTCGSSDCRSYCQFPGINAVEKEAMDMSETRKVTTQNKCLLEKHLIKYHKTLLMSIIAKVANGQLSSIVHPKMLIGFGEVQIKQVLDNCRSIMNIADVYRFVEIIDDSDDELDDLIMNEWATLVEDDELLNMVVENISLSHEYENETDIHELSSGDSTLQGSVPTSAIQALANLSITEGDEGII